MNETAVARPVVPAGVTGAGLSYRLPARTFAATAVWLAALTGVPAEAQVQCDCGSYLMSCLAGCLGNLYCNSRCQQFHGTCVSSCSGTYSSDDRHPRRDDDDDDDRHPRHRHW